MSTPRTYDRRRGEWTRDDVLSALRAFRDRYDRAPAATDFNPSDCRRSARISAARSRAWLERAERWYEGEYPYPRTVQRLFGSWNEGVIAAGMHPYRTPLIIPVEPAPDAEHAPEVTRQRWALVARTRDPEKLRRHLHGLADAALAWAATLPEPEASDG